MVAEEVIITLAGGAPWGFRLQGGVEHQRPLQVAKVRKRSKACRAGLREADELVSINEEPCGALSHAQAMALIDSSPGMLHIRVRRAPAGFQSVVLLTRAPSPRIDKEYRAALRAMSPSSRPHHHSHSRSCLLSPTGRSGITSPPGSEAYYGETDSDADVAAHERQRRQKRRSPSSSTPGKPPGRASPEGGETSEMSGYDSAPDARGYPGAADGGGEGLPGVGVARREVIYQPPGMWSSQTSTETSSIISSADDQGPPGGGAEEDSGFQELTNVPPLVSPERAKEAMMLASHSQLVPMVGPVGQPVDEELSTTYMDKAKQAKLNRGDTLQDKQVKEARTKCRTIASLLTDAPNPHSKGVLMFKKRRQRSKKYTLTSFGSVDEDLQQDSQEEDGIFPGSESEFDEDGFSAVPDPTWDSDYLDILEKRAAAAGRGDGAEDAPSPGLSNTTGKGAQLFEQQRKRAAEHARKVEAAQPQVPLQLQPQNQSHITEQPQLYLQNQSQPETQPLQMQPNAQPQPMMPPPPAAFQEEAWQVAPPPDMGPLSNGEVAYSGVGTASMAMSKPASVSILSSVLGPSQTPLPEHPSSSVLNRTARPFAPGFISSRAATAPVVFRPAVAKKPQRPATSASIVPPPFSSSSDLATNAPLFASSMSQLAPSGPTPIFSSPSSESGGPVSHSAPAPATPYLPAFSAPLESTEQAAQPMTTLPCRPVLSAMPSAQRAPVPQAPVSAPIPQMPVEAAQMAQVPIPVSMPSMPPAPAAFAKQPPISDAQPQPVSAAPAPTTPMSVAYYPVPAAAPTPLPGTPMSPPGGKTGILQDAWRRSGSRPMFRTPEDKKNSPNPELLNMVQNLDERPRRPQRWPTSEAAGYEDGEEDVRGGEMADRGRMAPPVAPKPRVIHEAPQIPKAEGKGAQLFARRQSRMDRYVVDTPLETPFQQELPHPAVGVQPCDLSINPSLPSQWKYSPNIRAPPPIGYNPLLAPTCPVGPQRDPGRFDRGRGGVGSQKEGIKAVDAMRRQPYQLNSAMFSYGGSAANLSAMPSYQAQRQQQHSGYTMVGSSLTPPKQIPVKAARVYEIKRFSTPTPMSAPTLATKVIAPRSATTLGEPMMRSDMTSPPPAFISPPRTPAFAPTSTPLSNPTSTAGLPSLPKLSATPIPSSVPIPHPVPYTGVSYPGASYTGLQAAKQFQSAPELSVMASLPPLRPTTIQVPKPRFIATRSGIKPHVWRPGAM